MENLEKSILNFFEKQRIDISKKQFLLACSGGKDSMVLAYALKNLSINFAIAHCNFQLRPFESDKDESFVQDFCKLHKIPFYVRKFQTQKLAELHAKSIQMTARELRYSFFHELIKEHSFSAVLTAHHLDDSMETQIINLGRGTGIKGLRGIAPKNGEILRPIHLSSRNEIDNYQVVKNISWREDQSNASDKYQRNYIRHHINPHLKNSKEGFEKGYQSSLKNIQSDIELFEFMLENIKNEICYDRETGFDIDLQKLNKYPSISSILNYILSPLGFADLPSLENILELETGKGFETKNYQAVVNRDKLLIREKTMLDQEVFSIEKKASILETPVKLSLERIKVQDLDFKNLAANSAALDFDKLQFPLVLRKWKKGDRFQALGMKKSKKLSDFFIDQKLNLFEKSALWLLCSGEDIVWIIGYRINDLYKITELTKTAYFVRPLK
tara:strand:+ start:1657 stop:2985 length:1329 start_codon:yes stop_codon:yes gene_type:complete